MENKEHAKKLCYENFSEIARDLVELGINVNCVPLLDVLTPKTHQIIGDRALGSNPKQVINLARQVCNACLDNKVYPIDIELKVDGDLHIDFHHTTEDSAIALGKAFKQALGDKKGINRYGFFYITMDETLTRVVIDLSGRIYPVWKVEFKRDKVGEMDTELFREWFFAFASAVGCNLHIENFYSINSHHIVESYFKGLAKALRQAVLIDEKQLGQVISTKGIL